MHQLNIKVEVFKEDDLYVALCPALNVSSFGESIDDAKKALLEAVEIFIEECSEMGTLDEVLEESTHHPYTYESDYRRNIQIKIF